jgi:hypothetical protein
MDNDWQLIYENMTILWEKEGKQSTTQIKKKAEKKKETAEKGVSDERMRELAKHDASREIRKSTSLKMFHRTSSNLNDSEKDRLNKEMEKTTTQNKVDKLAEIKYQEKSLKQKAKELKQLAKKEEDKATKDDLLARAEALEDKAKSKKASYDSSAKEKTKKKDSETKEKTKDSSKKSKKD